MVGVLFFFYGQDWKLVLNSLRDFYAFNKTLTGFGRIPNFYDFRTAS